MEIVLKYFVKTIDLHWPKMTVVKVAEDLLKFAGNGPKPKAKIPNCEKLELPIWKLGKLSLPDLVQHPAS